MSPGITIEALYQELQALKCRVAQLEEENKRIPILEKENAFLQMELAKYKTPKNSNNSSIPPSKDENRPRRNQTLREKTGKKPGGQKGRKGTTLKMVDNPDHVEKLIPDYCNCCGQDLREIDFHLISKRQVVDLPVIVPFYTEFQCYGRQCTCGHKQTGDYPENVVNHIQYGPGIEATVAYYSVYQYLPYRRLTKMFDQIFNLPISEGSIGNILNRMGEKANLAYSAIHEQVSKSKVVGGDESGCKVNGDKWWAWVWQNVLFTFITVSKSRGKQVIDLMFPHGFPNGILISDRWRAHLNTYARGHQLCIAHLLRELNYLIELEKTEWAKSIKTLFKKAIELKKEYPEYHKDDIKTLEIENEINCLLEFQLEKSKTPKTITFQNSLLKYREFLLTFLYHEEVTPDNNGAERGVRNFKVKLKVSGQFKTGQNVYAKLRSVIDTCIKSNVNVIDALKLIAKMPNLTSGE